MKKILIASVLMSAFSAALVAQAPQTSPAPSSGSLVVEGCVQPSVNAVSSTPDAVRAGGSVSTATAYILTRTEKPTGTSGSTANAAAIAPVYQLSAEDSKLIPHVGHKVEITGSLVSADKSSANAASSAPGKAPSPTLKVENVKMIAATCMP